METTQGAEQDDEPKRIQLQFSSDAADRLERLKQETHKSTHAGVVRDAMRVYEWFVEEQRRGNDIGVVKDGELIKIVKFQ